MGNYILGNFATIEEVIEGLKKINVVGSFIKDIQGEAPFHYAITDAKGRSIVVQYTKNGLEIHTSVRLKLCSGTPCCSLFISSMYSSWLSTRFLSVSTSEIMALILGAMAR